MNLIKIHYIKSKEVGGYSQIEKAAADVMQFLDDNNGKFKGEYPTTYAIAHAQVTDTPFSFFVVSKAVLDQNLFKHRVIINPVVISGEDLMVLKEGCMSFPHRKAKNVARYTKLKVQYDVQGISGALERITEDLIWPQSQIFQHEADHCNGKNIYFDA
jgi:peptide deformylase